MKVGIISNQTSQVGKSVLALMLGATFAGTQFKRTAIMGTGSLESLIDQVDVGSSSSRLNSINVFSAMLGTASLKSEEMLDYALHVGSEELYVFDIMSARIDDFTKEDLLIKTINRCPLDLTIIEFVGELNSPVNKRIMKVCDCFLYVYNPNIKSIKTMREWREKVDRSILVRTKFVCQMYNGDVVSEKRLSSDSNIGLHDLIVIPELNAIKAHTYAGTFNKPLKGIREGMPEVVSLRPKMLELMQTIFDSSDVKYIKGIGKWPRS